MSTLQTNTIATYTNSDPSDVHASGSVIYFGSSLSITSQSYSNAGSLKGVNVGSNSQNGPWSTTIGYNNATAPFCIGTFIVGEQNGAGGTGVMNGGRAFGFYNNIDKPHATAEGEFNTALGNYSKAEGAYNLVQPNDIGLFGPGLVLPDAGPDGVDLRLTYANHAQGYYTVNKGHSNATAGSGSSAENTALGCHVHGEANNIKGWYNHFEGKDNFENVAIKPNDPNVQSSNFGVHIEGINNFIFAPNPQIITEGTGIGNHIEGSDNAIAGRILYSHVGGRNCTISSSYSSQGSNSFYFASGPKEKGNHAKGYFNTIDCARWSHVGGTQNRIGERTDIEFYSESIQGTQNVNPITFAGARVGYSHAEGQQNTIRGTYNSFYHHAEGSHNLINFYISPSSSNWPASSEDPAYLLQWRGAHVEGYNNTIQLTGQFSRLMGQNGEISEPYTVAIGNGTLGNRKNLIEFRAGAKRIVVDADSLPTSDPAIVGQLFRTGSGLGDLHISLG